MCQADNGLKGEPSSHPADALQSDDIEDAEEAGEVDAALFFGAFGIAMLVFCPVIAIIDNVAGVLAFLVGVVMMGLGEWSERQQAQSRIEEAQRADTDGAEERTET